MNKPKLNSMQMMTLISAGTLGVDILTVPRRMVESSGQDAWISILLGGLLTLIFGTLAYILAVQYPDKDFPEILISIGGKFFGRLMLLIVAIYVLLYLGLSIKIFVQALLVFLLDKTPVFILMLLMNLVAGYAVVKGLETIGRVVDILFPLTIFTIFFVMLLALPQADPIRLKPILYNNDKNVLKSIIPAAQRFTGVGLILYYFKHTNKSKSSFLWFLAGICIPVFSYTALTLITIMVFGIKETAILTYPPLTLIKAIRFPISFLERLESFAAVFWIGIVFNAAVLFYYSSLRNITVFFSIPEKYEIYAIWAHLPLLMMIGQAESNVWEVLDGTPIIRTVQFLIVLGMIPLLAGYTFLKNRRRRPGESKKIRDLPFYYT
ncbi:MAG: endospore germination permease [Clostridiales bacterium]|jgi:spore germination protein|nr:endospore germination permease [Clostridiales bacterium]